MAHKSTSDKGSSSSRWTHSTKHKQILQTHEQQCLAIVPTFVVKVLPNQLERRLSPICLFFRHIQVIDKDDTLLTDRRTIVTFSAFLHFAVDGVLSLIGSRLSRKGQGNVLVSI